MLSNRYHLANRKCKSRCVATAFGILVITPTRCRDLHLKQFCLEDIVPAVLIILITHIVLAV